MNTVSITISRSDAADLLAALRVQAGHIEFGSVEWDRNVRIAAEINKVLTAPVWNVDAFEAFWSRNQRLNFKEARDAFRAQLALEQAAEAEAFGPRKTPSIHEMKERAIPDAFAMQDARDAERAERIAAAGRAAVSDLMNDRI